MKQYSVAVKGVKGSLETNTIKHFIVKAEGLNQAIEKATSKLGDDFYVKEVVAVETNISVIN